MLIILLYIPYLLFYHFHQFFQLTIDLDLYASIIPLIIFPAKTPNAPSPIAVNLFTTAFFTCFSTQSFANALDGIIESIIAKIQWSIFLVYPQNSSLCSFSIKLYFNSKISSIIQNIGTAYNNKQSQ